MSKDGIAVGDMGCREYSGNAGIQNFGNYLCVNYKGYLSGKTVKCRIESRLHKSMDGEFELKFGNGRFSGNIELTGEVEELSGHYEFKKL